MICDKKEKNISIMDKELFMLDLNNKFQQRVFLKT